MTAGWPVRRFATLGPTRSYGDRTTCAEGKAAVIGKFNWVQIDLGEVAEDADHYIDPHERFRVAMARQ